jgi:phage-related tail protein
VNELDVGAVDRLMERRHNLAAHMKTQEAELVATGQRLAALDLTIHRLRQKKARQTETTN